MVDMIVGTSLLVLGVGVLWRIAGRISVSRWPVIALGSLLGPFGILLYLPSSPFSINNDGLSYLAWGAAIADRWEGVPQLGYSDPIWPGKGIWPSLIAVLETILGPVEMTPLAVSVLALLSSFVVTQRSSKELATNCREWLLPLLVLTSPSLVLFGPSLLRESFFWLGVSFLVLSISQLKQPLIARPLLSGTIGSFFTLAFRPDVAIVLVYATIFILVWVRAHGRRLPLRQRLVVPTITICILGLSFPVAFDLMQPTASVAKVEAISAGLAKDGITTAFRSEGSAGTQVTAEGSAGTPSPFGCGESLYLLLICNVLENGPRTFFGPFFWELGPEPIWWLSSISTVHFWALVFLSLIGLYRAPHGTKWLVAGPIILSLVSMVVWAATLTNYGILIRFRGTTEIALLPSALLGASYLVTKLKKGGPIGR